MKATYDKEADAMYIRVKKGRVHKTLEVSDGVNVDADRKGKALGIELLFISSQMPRKSISKTIRAGIPVSAVAA
ncbi:hypothetical protein A3C21_02280 [Candidatus Kaiserbacteria bacterium RIFCSPHIGHO2_02_FULL_59_21]|uniref:DUF2283 domain-containing protein n=2 Tax=Candidatus Kaiseribacteriota TaxID=1752734 RepID=A0A0G1YVS4_9BACT|nr:MAG: hypothetical protein UY98_C0009G0005 [Candidatus Kaiserbacteria bacterium GW2011_GWA2_58_9]OGG62852.1 MAG: hypothetical protein A2766_04090 [Candidatus Kaiserbacteria bacterium RIFCSPHIGHO2_01_FULL_58_22]OGG67063.1 MAG: hypothetical protein A3C21_02280 [Candidatus Kaiserbacteria bacterium RIFCSPHIGHO2_02_FULL_59_21]OGG79479.1 MAG: hypothetical protein A2952_00250 [Candidatus Kaiserbacteria bacterium RIFCSPLOWO2_01_FULL_59_34]OGG86827.1 MAG: hypothetical protein A3I47_04140 [Candidatus K